MPSKFTKPRPTYFPAIIGPLFYGVQWMTDQFITSDSSWAEFVGSWPMGIIWAASIFFIVGLFVQDLYNKQSWIRENWRLFSKLFDVVALYAEHIETTPERVSVIFLFKYIKTIKSGEITITVTPQHISTAGDPFVIYHEKGINCPAYSDRRITICNLRVPRPNQPAIHSLWGNEVGDGNLKEGQQAVVGNSKNLVSVEVKSRWRKQRFEFIAEFCNPNVAPYVSFKDSYVHLIRLDEVINVHR